MKRKQLSTFILTMCVMLFGLTKSNGQIALDYNDTTLCPGLDITMCAAFSGQADGLNTDDYFTGIIDIGFPFTFYDNTYTACTVSGNGFLSFNISKSSLPSAYTWSNALAQGQLNNAIIAAMVDMNLATGGKIRYQHFGSPGSRRFVVEWCNIPLYGCSSMKVTTQIILYETTNVIEVHTTNITPIVGNCPSASSGSFGLVVQGVRDAAGLLPYYTPGRDPAGNWGTLGATNDARRFTPNGTSTYMIDTIPFNPWLIIDSMNTPSLKWYAANDVNGVIATGACATVTTTANIPYYVVKYEGLAGCLNDTVVLTDTVHVHFGTTYDTTNVAICAGESYSFFGKLLYAEGIYDTLFTSNQGCDSSIALRLTINPNPNVLIEGSSSIDICEGTSSSFRLSNPETTSTFQWTRDGNPIPGETGSEITSTESGVYRVIATTDKGCQAISKPYTLNVHPTPVAKIKPITLTEVMCAFDTLSLSADTDPSFQFRWEPGKAFRSLTGNESSTVTGIFDEPTNVILTVYNEFGCYGSDSVFVNTKPCCDVFIPNAFSPNGDGNNDYFTPVLQPSQTIVTFQVFNRTGQLVYDNANPKKGWDGKFENGKDAPAETYMYFIQYTCADGQNYTKKESFHLIK